MLPRIRLESPRALFLLLGYVCMALVAFQESVGLLERVVHHASASSSAVSFSFGECSRPMVAVTDDTRFPSSAFVFGELSGPSAIDLNDWLSDRGASSPIASSGSGAAADAYGSIFPGQVVFSTFNSVTRYDGCYTSSPSNVTFSTYLTYSNIGSSSGASSSSGGADDRIVSPSRIVQCARAAIAGAPTSKVYVWSLEQRQIQQSSGSSSFTHYSCETLSTAAHTNASRAAAYAALPHPTLLPDYTLDVWGVMAVGRGDVNASLGECYTRPNAAVRYPSFRTVFQCAPSSTGTGACAASDVCVVQGACCVTSAYLRDEEMRRAIKDEDADAERQRVILITVPTVLLGVLLLVLLGLGLVYLRRRRKLAADGEEGRRRRHKGGEYRGEEEAASTAEVVLRRFTQPHRTLQRRIISLHSDPYSGRGRRHSVGLDSALSSTCSSLEDALLALDDSDCCMCCRESMVGCAAVSALPCDHVFHLACLRAHVQQQLMRYELVDCPICHEGLLEAPEGADHHSGAPAPSHASLAGARGDHYHRSDRHPLSSLGHHGDDHEMSLRMAVPMLMSTTTPIEEASAGAGARRGRSIPNTPTTLPLTGANLRQLQSADAHRRGGGRRVGAATQSDMEVLSIGSMPNAVAAAGRGSARGSANDDAVSLLWSDDEDDDGPSPGRGAPHQQQQSQHLPQGGRGAPPLTVPSTASNGAHNRAVHGDTNVTAPREGAGGGGNNNRRRPPPIQTTATAQKVPPQRR